MDKTALERVGAHNAADPSAWLQVEPLSDVGPLDAQFGAHPKRTVPEALEPLFFPAPAQEGATVRMYALLEAAILPFLPELLEASDLRHKCLFSGEALADLGGVAPWLVELQDGSALTRALMTAAAAQGYWEREAGIFLRSAMPFDALWRHCRKFTRLQDEGDKWLFFRFWSSPVSTRLLTMGNRPELVQLIGPMFPAPPDDLEIVVLTPGLSAVLSRLPGSVVPKARPRLTQPAQETLRQIRRIQQFEDIIDISLPHLRDKTDLADRDMREMLRGKRDGFFRMGFWRRDHLAMLCCWEVLLGPDFVQTHSGGAIKQMLRQSQTAAEAIDRIAAYLDAEEAAREKAEADDAWRNLDP